MTDWNKEVEALNISDVWKPGTGTYKVKFLDDGVPEVYEGKDGKKTDQFVFNVEVNGEKKRHYVTKAKTINSLWGQITLLGRYHGSLVGKEFTYIITFDKTNNKRQYTIQEAIPLIQQYQENEAKKEA